MENKMINNQNATEQAYNYFKIMCHLYSYIVYRFLQLRNKSDLIKIKNLQTTERILRKNQIALWFTSWNNFNHSQHKYFFPLNTKYMNSYFILCNNLKLAVVDHRLFQIKTGRTGFYNLYDRHDYIFKNQFLTFANSLPKCPDIHTILCYATSYQEFTINEFLKLFNIHEKNSNQFLNAIIECIEILS